MLLDTGGQGSWIRQELADEAELTSIEESDHVVSGIGGKSTRHKTKAVECVLSSLLDHDRTEKPLTRRVVCKTIPKICNDLGPCEISGEFLELRHQKRMTEAYPRLKSTRVDILIGQDYLYDILQWHERHRDVQNKLLIWHTVFGAAISGGPHLEQPNDTELIHVGKGVTNDDLDASIKSFWTLEHFILNRPREDILSPSQRLAEQHFLKHVKFAKGRYTVTLPFSPERDKPVSNYKVALKQFLQIEQALLKDQNRDKRRKFIEAMEEYLTNDYAELAPSQDTRQGYFLPAHGVFKHFDNSPDSKMRIVFNASSKDIHGNSLNTALLDGVPLQPELFNVLIRFRMSPVCLVADIKAMFLQVNVTPHQRKYLKFVWRPFDQSPIKIYQMKVVTFGVINSPWLVQRVLRYHIDKHAKSFPRATKLIRNSFYVDDYVGALASVKDAISVHKELTTCLSNAGFHLTKCLSNSPAVMQAIPEKDRAKQAALLLQKDLSVSQDQLASTLGLAYDHIQDVLMINNILECMVPLPKGRPETKRTLCSRIASMYDPLGLLGPTLVQGKLLIQQCWIKQLGWDERLDTYPDLSQEYEKWVGNLGYLSYIHIPRLVIPPDCTRKRIVVFADASKRAYGAALYVVAHAKNGEITSSLLCSKSRVASPKAGMTIPRLELLATDLAAELSHKVKPLLGISEVVIFTDSTNVIQWLRKPPDSWKSFVANRVNNIQELYPNIKTFRHLKSEENVADMLSRGLSAKQLAFNHEWFSGPPWLAMPEEIAWPPIREFTPNVDADLEAATIKPFVLVTTLDHDILSNIFSTSNYFKDITKLAFVLRFIHNCKHPDRRYRSKWPTLQEIQNAHNLWITFVQESDFQDVLSALRAKQPCPKTSKVLALHPQIRQDGILVAGGRLALSITLPEQTKHPVLLPQKNKLVEAYVSHVHRGHGHPGPEQTLAIIRNKYWLVNSRREVRRILQKCKCYRQRARHFTQIMAPLPDYRTDASTPQAFLYTALDMFGPISVRNQPFPKPIYSQDLETRKTSRKAAQSAKRDLKDLATQEEAEEADKPYKAWGLLFTCLKTRGVHMEYVTTMDTDHFINGLQRFIARRGYVKFLYMDNARNFHKAETQLKILYKTLNWDRIERFCIEVPAPIQFHYVTPLASWKAGVHESMVKLVKTPLKMFMETRTVIPLEEFRTFLCQAEALVNFRPLTMISTGSLEDPLPITPFHLMTGRAMQAIPEHLGKDSPEPFNLQWQTRTKSLKVFWDMWLKGYCRELQRRTKWTQISREPRVGEIVMMKGDQKNRFFWPLAKIISVSKGSDNLCRTVELQTFEKSKRRVKLRGLQHIFRLEGDLDKDYPGEAKGLEGKSTDAGEVGSQGPVS